MNVTKRRQLVAVIGFVIVATMFCAALRVAVVHGGSMLPTFQDGEMVLVNRYYAFARKLEKGDVVLVQKDDDVLIKRVAYLPGDVIDGDDAASMFSVQHYFTVEHTPTLGRPWQIRLTVPHGYIVVLGDNKALSDDSRAFGPIPISKILGVVVNAPPKP